MLKDVLARGSCSGTLQYMSPDVVLVPPMGYGPEVRLSSEDDDDMAYSLTSRWTFGVLDAQ